MNLSSIQRAFFIPFLAALLWPAASAFGADPPQVINFQGRLTDPSNNPRTGSFSFTFKCFDSLTGGTQLPAGSAWSETKTIAVTNGVFNVLIGSNTAIPYAVFANNSSVYLEITVGAETLSPREQLIASPFAFNAEQVAGRTYDTFVDTSSAQVIDGIKTFSSLPVISGSLTPTSAGQLATKSYVDSLSGGTTNYIQNTSTLQAGSTFYVSSGTVVNNLTVGNNLAVHGTLSGNASSLTNLTAASISAGSLSTSVIASSIAVNTVYPAAVSLTTYGNIQGVGTQTQALNMGTTKSTDCPRLCYQPMRRQKPMSMACPAPADQQLHSKYRDVAIGRDVLCVKRNRGDEFNRGK